MNGKGAREDKENKQKKKKKKCFKKTVRPENLIQCSELGCIHDGTLKGFTLCFSFGL